MAGIDKINYKGTEYNILEDFQTDVEENKANIDGYYESLTAGNAEQLISTILTEDNEPYTYRTSGGSADIGNREYDEVVGGTVAWNQLVQNRNFVNDVTDSRTYVAFRFRLGVSPYTRFYDINIGTAGMVNTVVKVTETGAGQLMHNGVSHNLTFAMGFNVITNHAYFISANFTGVDPTVEGGVVAKDIQVIDLTQMFGSTVADYIYSLEQAEAGAGVAFFRKLFPLDYYEYNAGELMHVSGVSSHDTVGFNQWDEEWELGVLNSDGTIGTASNRIVTKNYIPVVPNSTYCLTTPFSYNTKGRGAYYNANKELLSYFADFPISDSGNYGTNGDKYWNRFTAPEGACYLKYSLPVSYGTTYNHDICINLSWSGYRNGEYEPYVKHSYPLDDSLTLRGIPKLDASNNLYYDGDTYADDGTVTRRYGIVDLGTLNWVLENGVFRLDSSIGAKLTAMTAIANIICSKYPTISQSDMGLSTTDKCIAGLNWSNGVRIKDSTYTDAASFKTAMSGVYMVYELATPTTEEAEPYTNPQIVDDFGTEEYVTTSIVPVGHNTKYMANLRDKLQHLPDLADSDGYYMISQSNHAMSLELFRIPKAPTTDGMYTLKATVSGGTPTYTWVDDSEVSGE